MNRDKLGSFPVRLLLFVVVVPPVMLILLWLGIGGLFVLEPSEAIIGLAWMGGVVEGSLVVIWVLFELGYVRLDSFEASDDE